MPNRVGFLIGHTMANNSPAFQFYPNDWLSSPKVMLMTPAHEGAYIRLLALCWSMDGLPDDDDQLATLSRLGEGWFNGGSTVLRNCFILKGGKLYNHRLLEEKKKQAEWKEKSRKGGIASAKARQQKKLQHTKSVKGGSTVVDDCLTNGINQKPTLQSSSSSSYSTTTITKQHVEKIYDLWNSFAKKKANPDDLNIEQQLNRTLNDIINGCSFDQFIGAIENYRLAIKLPKSQAWHFNLYNFALEGFKKFLPGVFDIDNYDKSNFKEGGNNGTNGHGIKGNKQSRQDSRQVFGEQSSEYGDTI